MLLWIFLTSVLGLIISGHPRTNQDIQKNVSEQNVSKPKPVKITVLYESLCPDSMNFITRQLEPTYRVLGDIMDIELHAYGKAKTSPRSDGGYDFDCQHGETECYRNKILECAKNYIKPQPKYLNFVFCMMKRSRKMATGISCAESVGATYDEISSCVEGIEGEKLLFAAGEVKLMKEPFLNYVPRIAVNGEYSRKIRRSAERRLKADVCDAYQGPNPAQCQ